MSWLTMTSGDNIFSPTCFKNSFKNWTVKLRIDTYIGRYYSLRVGWLNYAEKSRNILYIVYRLEHFNAIFILQMSPTTSYKIKTLSKCINVWAIIKRWAFMVYLSWKNDWMYFEFLIPKLSLQKSYSCTISLLYYILCCSLKLKIFIYFLFLLLLLSF